jgi:hypothetical protein
MADRDQIDQELKRLLESAGQRSPVEVPATVVPHQAATWPWQVPQVPTCTLDRTPVNNS